MKVRKLPVTVEAWPVPGRGEQPCDELRELVAENGWEADDEGILIPTWEGTLLASPGDYLIRGVGGEFYPCKPDIFAKTYEVLE